MLTLSTIASGIAAAVNANTSLQAIGVSATAVSTVVNIKSTSVNSTTYTQSKSAGATETITLGTGTGIAQSLYNNVNELVNIQSGGSAKYQGTANKALKSATVATPVIVIKAPVAQPTSYSTLTSSGATETLTLGTLVNGNDTVTVGGTITAGNTVTLEVNNPNFNSGYPYPVTYTVQSTDTTTTIATALAAAINADANLPQVLLSATSSGAVVSLNVSPPTYTTSTSGGATETLTVGTNVQGNTTVTVGGTKTTGDVLTVTTKAQGISGGTRAVSYTVLSTDTIASISAALANALNSDTVLQPLGFTAANSSIALNWSESFAGNAQLAAGSNMTTTTGTDGASNTKTNTYQVSANSASGQTLTYDLNGNLTNDGTNTYQWDAENRLVQINYPGTGNNSQFMFDGFGRCVKIVETAGGTTTSTRQFVWCGSQMREDRNASSSVIAQYFGAGQTISGGNYYYTTDHEGSVREVTSSAGAIQAEYSYDPYGRITLLQGSLSPDFQYAGYYYHASSGLLLTLNRAYNPSVGRWINRDPIAEKGGLNLYDYVRNTPVRFVDPLGLWYFTDWNDFGNDNWTGPGLTNGHQGNLGELDPFFNSGAVDSWNNGPFHSPRNPWDMCSYDHDRCLNVCARIEDREMRKCCRRNCDHQMGRCLFFTTFDPFWPYFFRFVQPNNNYGEYKPNLGSDPSPFFQGVM